LSIRTQSTLLLVKDADNEHVQSVYNFTSYRKFIAAWITSRPLGGKGERLKLARAARIHPSLITQILNGNKELTSEQAFLLSQHCGLQGAEREYFQDLVQWERAGDPQYKAWLGDKLKGMRSKGRPEIDAGDLAPLSEYERAVLQCDPPRDCSARAVGCGSGHFKIWPAPRDGARRTQFFNLYGPMHF